MVNSINSACADEQNKLEIAQLEAIKAGFDPARIAASIKLGIKQVEGDMEKGNPYTAYRTARHEVLYKIAAEKYEPEFSKAKSEEESLKSDYERAKPSSVRRKLEQKLMNAEVANLEFDMKVDADLIATHPNDDPLSEKNPAILGKVCLKDTRANLAAPCAAFWQNQTTLQ